MRKTVFVKVIAAAAALGLVLAGCGDDGGSADDGDDGITIGSPGDDSAAGESGNGESGNGESGNGESGNGEGGGESGGSETSNSGDLQVVWPLPEGDFTVWLPYQLIDDSFQYAESASFQSTSGSVDDMLAFYREYFPTIGLMTNEFPAGTSTAMNLTDPTKPGWSGVVQIGLDPDGVIVLNQNYTDLIDQGTTSTTEPPAEAVSEGSATDG